MQIKLYRTTSEHNKLEKVLENELEVNGVLRDQASILTPSFAIGKGQGITNYNYAYIGAFNRYYYITDIVSVNNNLWEISCSVDPLMSWADEIKKITAICSRSSTVFNRYLVDPEFQNDARALVQYKEIGSFTDQTPVLLVIGGDYSGS